MDKVEFKIKTDSLENKKFKGGLRQHESSSLQ